MLPNIARWVNSNDVQHQSNFLYMSVQWLFSTQAIQSLHITSSTFRKRMVRYLHLDDDFSNLLFQISFNFGSNPLLSCLYFVQIFLGSNCVMLQIDPSGCSRALFCSACMRPDCDYSRYRLATGVYHLRNS